MSEETQSSEEKIKSIDAERLRQQADELRQSGYLRSEEPPKGLARWLQAVYLSVLVLIIASVVFLLVFGESRGRLLRGAGHVWARLASTEQDPDIFKLPPPPPKAVEPKVVYQGSPTFVFRAGSPSGQPGSETDAAEPEAEGLLDESKPPAPPAKTAGSSGAYELLVKESEVARKISTNGFPDLQFKEWKPVRNSPPEFWINMVASRAGQNVEFVWSVNTESGTIRALSQNARDLERK